MRKLYHEALKDCFNRSLICCDCRNHSTHAQMAQILAMDVRSYIDLDHGKSCCSGLTLALFLIYCCDDPAIFLEELKQSFEGVEVVKSA